MIDDTATPIRSGTPVIHSMSPGADSTVFPEQGEQGRDVDATSSQSRPLPPQSRRRDKPQLSCNYCRKRKSKCDRRRPCSTCSSRGQVCIYPDHGTSVLLDKPASAASSGMHERIVHLERLVMSLMAESGRRQTVPPSHLHAPGPRPPMTTPDPETAPGVGAMADAQSQDASFDERSECGSMHVSASEIRYVNGNHWAAILDSIADLKEHFDREEQHRLVSTPDDEDHDRGGSETLHSSLLYGSARPMSRADILAALPPKSAVDRYVSRYFNLIDLAAYLFHAPTFVREYESFWNNQSRAPIMWVGLLYSIICLAVIASDDNAPEQRALQIDLYREKVVQALITGEYTRASPYTLETLIQYVHIEFLTRPDAEKDIWFLIGLIQSLARRMGYHRDPSHFPGISPLQGEIRRRIWITVLQGDILISSQMGMPRLVSDWQCDTLEPRNLNDADLEDAAAELPPSRFETELTPALECIARRRVLLALGKVLDLTSSVKPPSYTEIMRVDGILTRASLNIPPRLRMKPMAASVTDTPQVIMARLFLSHILYKGRILLHRHYLFAKSPPAEHDPFVHSRRACLDACLGTLEIQRILDEETCPGGQLRAMRWRVTSSMNHAFLTATMILCAVLHGAQASGREEEITAALRRTRAIWMRARSCSREANKAAEAVSFVLAAAARRLDEPPSNEGLGESMAGGGNTGQPPSTVGDSDVEMSLDGQKTLEEFIGLDATNRFIEPSLLGTFTPPGQHDPSLAFDFANSGNADWNEYIAALDKQYADRTDQ